MILDWQKKIILYGAIFYIFGFFIFSAAELSGKMYGVKKNGYSADYKYVVKGDKKIMKVQSENSSQKKEQAIKDLVCRDGDKPVYKKVLKNGLTVLVRPMHTIPEVSLQIWYKVGSKDEKSGERGIAHLIEHMIFKGTQGTGSLPLSESDINIVVHKLSGSCNAFTSYDYTGYLFNFPTHHWKEVLPIMADCMQHCAFKDDHLSSEMKAVIQELKLYRDEYADLLLNELLAAIFPDHPYHYPIIGHKQDLWSVSGEDLRSFYKKHYIPNNATLVVVGDVDYKEVFVLAERYLGNIQPNKKYQRAKFYHADDISSKSVTLYRDIQQPFALITYAVPGLEKDGDYVFDVIAWILGKGKGSRLYSKLVDELKLVTSFKVSYIDLFEYGLFIFSFEPKKIEDFDKIEEVIQKEIDSIVKEGVPEKELERAQKNVRIRFYNLLESAQGQAYEIGKYYTALGNEQYVFTVLDEPLDLLKDKIQKLFKMYFRPTVRHKGVVLPLPEEDKKEWIRLQEHSDKEDEKILSARIRTSPIESPVYAKRVTIKDPGIFDFPKPEIFILSNGLKVLTYCNTVTPKINLVIEFKANWYYDSTSKPGLYAFLTKMMMEGTKKYTAAQLADEIESRGMSLTIYPGGVIMSMLSSDLDKGLELLEEVLSHPRFDKDEIEKVRVQQLADIKNFWDEPRYFSNQLVKERIYKRHPYSKNILGTEESVKSITRDDLITFYDTYISPKEARLAIVGDLKEYNVKTQLEKGLGKFTGSEIADIEFPPLSVVKPHDINYRINRDQVVLCFAGLSIKRKSEDFDKLLLFDQIFGGGVLGSLHSRLFQLREQSGLFYGINGTLLAQSSEQPGMVMVKTLVSLDRLEEAEKAIHKVVATVIDDIKEEELTNAKRAVINSLTKNFETNMRIAQSFLFLDRYDFPRDFFDTRALILSKISLDDVKEAVKKYLKNDALLVLRVGRIKEEKSKE